MSAIEKHRERFKDQPQLQKQIGCSYCKHESKCKIIEPMFNKAKEGCQEYEHHQF